MKKTKKVIDEIFEKYGVQQNKQFQSEYPEWFVDSQREHIMNIMQNLIDEITSANSIYAISLFEFDKRRNHQNEAIACCFKLYQELQYIIAIFPIDLNNLIPIFASIDE